MAWNFTVMTSGQAVNHSAEVQSALEFFATAHSCRVLSGLQERSLPFADRARRGFAAHTQGAFSQRRCCESSRAKLQSVLSEVCRTPVCGQAVKQSAEMRSALVFFATAQLFRERSLESVN